MNKPQSKIKISRAYTLY